MNQHHYDIIVLGDSLASRLAAVLLAKAGKRVLSFRSEQPSYTPWLFNSVHLSQVLEQLGGRNSLTTARKLQIISGQTRLELHGKQPLPDELRREFPFSHNQVANILQKLEVLGNRLESQLLSCGGLPLFGLADRLRFRKKLLLSRSGFRCLRKPLKSLLDEISDSAPRFCLDALFSGLAMAPTNRLSIAEGALLWSSANQPQGISKSVLDDLLLRRYEQFHGINEPIDSIERIGENGTIYLKNSGICSAEALIIGSLDAVGLLPLNNGKTAKVPSPPWRWTTSPILIGTSPILASRVILAEPFPLRVTLTPTPTGTVGIAEFRDPARPSPPSEEEVKAQLAGILPFAAFNLSPHSNTIAMAEKTFSWPSSRSFPGTSLRLRLNKHLYLGSGADAVPNLGATGEIMTGVALAHQLSQSLKK